LNFELRTCGNDSSEAYRSLNEIGLEIGTAQHETLDRLIRDSRREGWLDWFDFCFVLPFEFVQMR
jgi:hypothetical protein